MIKVIHFSQRTINILVLHTYQEMRYAPLMHSAFP